ncbi:MAG: DUF3619 family protein [Gallionella sp.]|nr:DUF3619 family protein [Gallionella sp.]
MSPNKRLQDLSPEHVARLLTQGTEHLDNRTLSALARVRLVALHRCATRNAGLTLDTGHHAHWGLPHTTSQWGVTAVLLIAIITAGASYWRHLHEHEMSHLDVAILTDDLPLEVFVDH